MARKRSKSVERVRQHLRELGQEIEVVELDKSTRTAQMAADALGTELGSIVKSLVFLADDQPTLVLVAGDKRADSTKLKTLLKARRVTIADAERVRDETGFAIGGVPPVGHKVEMTTIIDSSLGRFQTVYAAAGSPHAIFPVTFDRLVEISGGQVADVIE